MIKWLKEFWVEWWGLLLLPVIIGGIGFFFYTVVGEENRKKTVCETACGVSRTKQIDSKCHCKTETGWKLGVEK